MGVVPKIGESGAPQRGWWGARRKLLWRPQLYFVIDNSYYNVIEHCN